MSGLFALRSKNDTSNSRTRAPSTNYLRSATPYRMYKRARHMPVQIDTRPPAKSEVERISESTKQLLQYDLEKLTNNDFLTIIHEVITPRLEDFMHPREALEVADNIAHEITRHASDIIKEIQDATFTAIDRFYKQMDSYVQQKVEMQLRSVS